MGRGRGDGGGGDLCACARITLRTKPDAHEMKAEGKDQTNQS